MARLLRWIRRLPSAGYVVRVVDVQPGDVIFIESDGLMSVDAIERLKQQWLSIPELAETRVVVLEEARLGVMRRGRRVR